MGSLPVEPRPDNPPCAPNATYLNTLARPPLLPVVHTDTAPSNLALLCQPNTAFGFKDKFSFSSAAARINRGCSSNGKRDCHEQGDLPRIPLLAFSSIEASIDMLSPSKCTTGNA